MADEYGAAQERGDVAKPGERKNRNIPDENISATVDQLGLSSKQIHEGRMIRDAEAADPGVISTAKELVDADKGSRGDHHSSHQAAPATPRRWPACSHRQVRRLALAS